MPPLAHMLAKQLIEPVRRREPFWAANSDRLRDMLADAVFFEVTAAQQMLPEVMAAVQARGLEEAEQMLGRFTFLPAPKTFLEIKHPRMGRYALFAEANKDETSAAVSWVLPRFAEDIGTVNLQASSPEWEWRGGYVNIPREWLAMARTLPSVKSGRDAVETLMPMLLGHVHWLLLLINSPHIVGRQQHMPHAGLERRLTRALGAGMFPLRGWTEIKLEINKPEDVDDGEPHEAHLTGRRALHFCRKHIRIKNGRLEYVRAHWRGDPALGIKRSRYKLMGAA